MAGLTTGLTAGLMVRERVALAACLAGLAAAAAVVAGGPAGAQERGVVADTRGVTCETVMVRMRDGVRLATDVYRPAVPPAATR